MHNVILYCAFVCRGIDAAPHMCVVECVPSSACTLLSNWCDTLAELAKHIVTLISFAIVTLLPLRRVCSCSSPKRQIRAARRELCVCVCGASSRANERSLHAYDRCTYRLNDDECCIHVSLVL